MAQILEAARSLDPDALTMQAVADRLGVDRKAVNHHVNDREKLLTLMATDTFSTNFSAVEIDTDQSWQSACRAYARGFIESTLSAGVLADRIRLDDTHVTQVLKPTEAVLKKMTQAGFGDEEAMRALSLLANICLAHTRDRIAALRSGVKPRQFILQGALESRDPAEYEVLTRIAALPVSTYDQAQLDYSIEVFLSGAETLLRRTSGAGQP
ncbi:TetR/AcrR family transcriptional regulator [Actinoplanes sp. ATCC 53533]|uniref:TetR/AcrR family transcriptional regulator n=1 Tax=Actinoplanes sp. ATCC 53533 TaxID=1288362 RepID=UPI0013155E1A|nr:TetR/AcrR family transcriptional regulator C-terminal domain-containing protein [Actinoplanes sp. ATCC 53533]